MSDETIVKGPLSELQGVISEPTRKILLRRGFRATQAVRDAQGNGRLASVPQLGRKRLAEIRRGLAQLDGTHIPSLREAAEAVLDAYQNAMRDGLEPLRDGMTALRETLDNRPGLSGLPEHQAQLALLGKWVRVTLDHEDNAIIEGQLLSFGDGGDFEIRGDDGMTKYCWPALDIQEAAGPVTDVAPEREKRGEYANEPLFPAPSKPIGASYPYVIGSASENDDGDGSDYVQGDEPRSLPPENPRRPGDFADYVIDKPGNYPW